MVRVRTGPRGGDRAYNERHVGYRQEVGDQAEEPGSEGFAVGEGAVGEARRHADGLDGVGKEGDREHCGGGFHHQPQVFLLQLI